jgi:serine/threonine-protein kinase
MRSREGETKLGDFGIARSSDSTVVTEHGAVIGTAAYLAPEQARGEAVTGAADLYALGVVLYEALTGRLPHEGASLPELLLKRERDAPTPVRQYAAAVPAELERAITRSLAHAPENRQGSAAELGRELALALPGAATGVLPGRGVEATRVVAPARAARTQLIPARSRRALAIPAALLLAVLALGAGVWAAGGESPRAPNRRATPPPAQLQPPPPPPPVAQPVPVADCDERRGKDHGKRKGHDKGKHCPGDERGDDDDDEDVDDEDD